MIWDFFFLFLFQRFNYSCYPANVPAFCFSFEQDVLMGLILLFQILNMDYFLRMQSNSDHGPFDPETPLSLFSEIDRKILLGTERPCIHVDPFRVCFTL